MRRLIFGLAVALTAFIVGVAAASLRFFSREVPCSEIKVSDNCSAPVPTKQERSLVRGMVGDGIASCGRSLSLARVNPAVKP